MTDRFIVLGLAPARAEWFRTLAKWANDGSARLQFVKCVSAAEVRANLRSNRTFSALIVDGWSSQVDRDLIDAARDRGVPTFVAGQPPGGTAWADLGAVEVLAVPLNRDDLHATLDRHASPVDPYLRLPQDPTDPTPPDDAGDLTVVCGPGGTGASTVAIALAQAAASDPISAHGVVLVDGARRAELAMLHDVGDVIPGLADLVDAHRNATPSGAQVRAHVHQIPTRGYDLLLGLRRPHHWSVLRPRALDATVNSLLRTWAAIIVDADSDAEAESLGGSADVERRNGLTRRALAVASRVVVVGQPGTKGLFSLANLVHELIDAGAKPGIIVPVVNGAPRGPIHRAELVRAFTALMSTDVVLATAGPTFVGHHRRLDASHRDVTRFPEKLIDEVGPLRLLGGPPTSAEPVAVAPGSLGAWEPTS